MTEGKRILMLGGSLFQVPAIERAKELGMEVFTCGNLPSDPGHALASSYHPVSTTDLEGVLDLARALRVDGVSAYASDPAAVTAAYVSEKLGLPGDPFEATRIVQDKVEFRRVQAELGVPAPEAFLCTSPEQVMEAAKRWAHGGIIKPVDASGSKGVHVIAPDINATRAAACFADARAGSRSGRAVMEQFLTRKGPQLTGDVVVHEGRVRAWCFGDVHFDERINGLVPTGVTIPGTVPAEKVEQAMADVQRIITRTGLRQGVYNIDIFVDDQDRPIVVDIAARPGGNMLTTLYQARTGVDMMEAAIRMTVGDAALDLGPRNTGRYVAHMVLHSHRAGILRAVRVSDLLRKRAFYERYTTAPGQAVEPFTAANKRLGLLLLEFTSAEEMADVYAHPERHVQVELEGDPPEP